MRKNNFTKIEKIISAAKKGEMYILVDDENRENEGDLVVPASIPDTNAPIEICAYTTNKKSSDKLKLKFLSGEIKFLRSK